MLLKRGIKISSVKTLLFLAKNDEKTGKGSQRTEMGGLKRGSGGGVPRS